MKRCAGFAIIIIAMIACEKTNEENESGPVPNPVGCDTINMKYATNIQPIIQNNCYSCHANGQAEGGVTLDTYNKIKQRADNGILIGVITHASGFKAMPFGLPKLSDCNINKIKAWVARGALDN